MFSISCSEQQLCFFKKRELLFQPGSAEEMQHFAQIQDRFAREYENFFPDPLSPKTIVVVPSLSLDQEILSKIDGFIHYEERMLCMLILLRMPCTHVVYLSSMPIDPVIIDYYLHLLPGISSYHASKRLTLLSCYDSSTQSLTQKILDRPRIIERIRQAIPSNHLGHIACFNVTHLERSLAVQLNLPIYGTDPALLYLGTKSGSRKLFKECGVALPEGVEWVKNEEEMAMALVALKLRYPHLKKAVVKLEEGFSGDGNAIFNYEHFPFDENDLKWVLEQLPHQLHIIAKDLGYRGFMDKFNSSGGIVEVFIEGNIKKSPSVQCRITPMGKVEIISTHDQLLGGEEEQVFLGASFPAHQVYHHDICTMGKIISEQMKTLGVLGRYSIDFISVQNEEGSWSHYAIEINLRKGGTTHPYLMLQFLTDGYFDEATGYYITANKQKRFYFSSDNVQHPSFKGLTPQDLMEIACFHDLLYDSSKQEGVMFHLIGALSQYGKLGLCCIASSPEKATSLYNATISVLLNETKH